MVLLGTQTTTATGHSWVPAILGIVAFIAVVSGTIVLYIKYRKSKRQEDRTNTDSPTPPKKNDGGLF